MSDNFNGILCVIDIDSDPIDTFDFLSSFDVDIDFLLPLQNYQDYHIGPIMTKLLMVNGILKFIKNGSMVEIHTLMLDF